MVLYIMTIYLAKITKSRDYDEDITIAAEAFSTMEKAEAFMVSEGMMKNTWGEWSGANLDYTGEIWVLTVK